MTNWNMICDSSLTLGLFGMSYFAGFALGFLIVPVFSDLRGRKHIWLGGIFIGWAMMAIQLKVDAIITPINK